MSPFLIFHLVFLNYMRNYLVSGKFRGIYKHIAKSRTSERSDRIITCLCGLHCFDDHRAGFQFFNFLFLFLFCLFGYFPFHSLITLSTSGELEDSAFRV